MNNVSVIAAVNNRMVLESNLLRSPLLRENNVQFIAVEGFVSASKAYNHGIMAAAGEFLVFAHQDVYIPAPWYQQLLKAMDMVEKKNLPWSVLGVIGVDGHGFVKGQCWSTGLGREVGIPVKQPEPAVSLDELIIIVRKNSGLLFDENLPGWHLYGTDIVQTALERGLGVYIVQAPVIHNSLPTFRLDARFAKCCHYIRRKWSHRLPIQSTCVRVTQFGWPLLKKRIRQLFNSKDRNTFPRLPNPAVKARELGYE